MLLLFFICGYVAGHRVSPSYRVRLHTCCSIKQLLPNAVPSASSETNEHKNTRYMSDVQPSDAVLISHITRLGVVYREYIGNICVCMRLLRVYMRLYTFVMRLYAFLYNTFVCVLIYFFYALLYVFIHFYVFVSAYIRFYAFYLTRG